MSKRTTLKDRKRKRDVYLDAASKISIELCEEFMFFANIITRAIAKEHPGISGANHTLSAVKSRISVADAMGVQLKAGVGTTIVKDKHGLEIPITIKDRKILDCLRKEPDKYFSPTDLGIKLHGHNRSSASSWAYRSLNKFHSLGYVDRNRMGHYRYTGGEPT